MDGYKPTTPDDVLITIPSLRDPKSAASNDAVEVRDLGQHGGAAEAAAAVTDAHGAAAGDATDADPQPQRDDPDDGEHTDSTEEAVAARAPVPVVVDESQSAPETGDEAMDVTEAAEETQEPLDELNSTSGDSARIEPRVKELGSQPRVFQRIGFSSGDVDVSQVGRFPQPLIDHLRASLAPSVGADFAQAISSTALLTAFISAKTGFVLEVDPNTAVAIDVFRQVDPRLLSVEDRMEAMASDMALMSTQLLKHVEQAKASTQIIEALEYSNAYIIADRVAGISTNDTDEHTVDVTQKRVVIARDTIRKSAAGHRKIERERSGRRMA
ncbi:hypothetical protein [Plantibacter flavus]|nr:hypothetical protein [Plantibacter flavus]